jgi:VCBS repeat-containing protein
VTVSITGLNDAPVAHLDSASAVENGAAIAIDVLANDDDIDSDDDRGTLRIVAASAASGAMVSFAGLAGAGIVYHPSSSGAFAGLGLGETAVDAISYTIEDSHGARAVGSASVTIAGRNDAPTAVSDQGETNEDTAVTLAVLANDTDPDLHDRLSISAINGTATTPVGPLALASGALVTPNLDGTLRYDPAAAFSHLARGQAAVDTFSYTAADGHGGTGTATVSVTVNGRNDAPLPGADALTTDASTHLTVAASTLLANDTDPDAGDGVAVVGIDTSAAVGSVTFDGTTITYDPHGRFRGLGEGETVTDTFTYRVADHDGATATGTVSVTVRGVNDPPTASDDGGSPFTSSPTTPIRTSTTR